MPEEAVLDSGIDVEAIPNDAPFTKNADRSQKQYFGRYKGAIDANGVPEYLDLAAIRHRLNNVQPREIVTHIGTIPMSDHFTLMPHKAFVARLNAMIDALICDARQAHGVREGAKIVRQLQEGVAADEVKIEPYVRSKHDFWFVER